MPLTTGKRRLLNAHRSQLLFSEHPRCGATHNYGPQLRSAINPRSFISEQSRQGVPVPSWVSPQFTSLEDTTVGCNGQRKKKKNPQLRMNTLNRTSHSTQVRSTVCKYPTLLFATSNTITSGRHGGRDKNSIGDSTETSPPQGQSEGTIAPVSRDETLKPSVNTPGAQVTPKHDALIAGKPTSSLTPHTSSILTPPHIQTPEMARREHAAPSCLLFSQNQLRTPSRTENVLVRDTPESDYGLRVTWRRRKKLMRLLAERGQLLHTDAMTSIQSPEGV